jgi:hypothetical protein
MGKVIVNDFSGGISADTRDPSTNKFAISKNFDIFSHPRRLMPFPGMTPNETQAYFLTDFVYGDFGTGIGSNVLAYGVQSGQAITGHPELYMKSGDLLNGGWTTALTATGAASGTRGPASTYRLFHLYHNYVYFRSGQYIGRTGDLANGTAATLVDTYYDLTFNPTTVTEGFTHPKDDIMYFGVDNKLYRNNAGTITLALTLPTYLYLSSVTNDGNYLAIACKPASNVGSSVVYLWDRDTSLTTLSESIDWGNGVLKVLHNIEGTLVGVSLLGATIFDLMPKIVIKTYSGGVAETQHELVADNTSIALYDKKARSGNKLYFGAKITLNGTNYNGMFVVSKNSAGDWSVTHDVNIDNDTALTGNIEGFNKLNDIWFVAHNGDGSVNRTISDGSYAGTSIYESQVNPNMPLLDRSKSKQLMAASLSYLPLPTNGQVILKYRVDGGSWVTIFTETGDGATITERTKTDAGDEFTAGREYEFHIECTGGAVVTELAYNCRIDTSAV